MAGPMMGLGELPPEPAPGGPEPGMDASDMGGELETHMTTFINAVKAGQSKKAANAMKNFVEACRDEGEDEEGGY